MVQCYAKGMTQNGGKIVENCRITAVEPIDYGLSGYQIQTSLGNVSCDKFINCAGQWARNLGQLSGVNIPLSPCQHYYIVSKPSTSDKVPVINSMMPIVFSILYISRPVD